MNKRNQGEGPMTMTDNATNMPTNKELLARWLAGDSAQNLVQTPTFKEVYERLGKAKLAKACKGLEGVLVECQGALQRAMDLERSHAELLQATQDAMIAIARHARMFEGNAVHKVDARRAAQRILGITQYGSVRKWREGVIARHRAKIFE